MRGRFFLVAIAAAAAAPGVAQAGRCWNPLGCEPTTYQECVQQAADSKTDVAAKALIAQCDRFKVTQAACEADAGAYRDEVAHPNQRMLALRIKMDLAGLDDYAALTVIQGVHYPDIPLQKLAADFGVKSHPDRALCQRFHADLYR